LERWVEGPGGRMELVEMPLTPELFLNPQVGDNMTQGSRHVNTAREIADRLEDFFRPAPDVLVTVFEHPSGRPLPTRREIEETAKAEAQARKAAET